MLDFSHAFYNYQMKGHSMKQYKVDQLTVHILPTRSEMGQKAAADIREKIISLLAEKETINIIFAAAPSQNEVLASLVEAEGIEWNRIHAYHMDEYIGLPAGAEQAFGRFLKNHIFDLVPFASVNLINATATDPDAEAKRYADMLSELTIDMIVMGIGENGHIAFNDPPVANFNDPVLAKPVKLDEVCRMQQVNDGCFATIDDVPTHAITLTVPVFKKAGCLFCIVPAFTKANAVYETLNGTIDEHCPATILRQHPAAQLYLDGDSASLL